MSSSVDSRELRVAVTGGSRGIGKAVAKCLSEKGWSVAILYRSEVVAASTLADSLNRAGRSAIAFQADVRSRASLDRAADLLRAWGSPLHGLVCSAGVYDGQSTAEITEDASREIVETDLLGTFRTVQAFLPLLAQDGRASIVTVSSILGSHPAPGGVPYQMAKAGVEQMTRALALELAPKIRVNCISPGFIRTDMNRPAHGDPKFRDQVARRTPLARWGEPEDLGAPVEFLLGPEASWITGTVLHVDGGLGLL